MKELSLKEIQKGSFEILSKFKEICTLSGFKYFLIYGTLLGAARHGGTIPWDDDIDVAMPREDYEKFIAYCKENEESLRPLELMHYSVNENYVYPIARLSDSRYATDYSNTVDYGLGLFIDVYPIDGADESDGRYLKKLKRMVRKIYFAGCKKADSSPSFVKRTLKKIYFRHAKRADLNKLLARFDELSRKYRAADTGKCWIAWDCPCFFDTDMFEESDELPFEGELFTVPKDYKKALTMLYGDYMTLPPEEERTGHHNYKVWRK